MVIFFVVTFFTYIYIIFLSKPEHFVSVKKVAIINLYLRNAIIYKKKYGIAILINNKVLKITFKKRYKNEFFYIKNKKELNHFLDDLDLKTKNIKNSIVSLKSIIN